jgi:hypothetical protein
MQYSAFFSRLSLERLKRKWPQWFPLRLFRIITTSQFSSHIKKHFHSKKNFSLKMCNIFSIIEVEWKQSDFHQIEANFLSSLRNYFSNFLFVKDIEFYWNFSYIDFHLVYVFNIKYLENCFRLKLVRKWKILKISRRRKKHFNKIKTISKITNKNTWKTLLIVIKFCIFNWILCFTKQQFLPR